MSDWNIEQHKLDSLECDRRQAQPGNGVHRCPACTQYVANVIFLCFVPGSIWAGCSAAAHLELNNGEQTFCAVHLQCWC